MSYPPLLDPLRIRMAQLVADGPIRAREGYAVLMGEGWSRSQVDKAKREAVRVVGVTKVAWWRKLHYRSKPSTLTARRAERRARKKDREKAARKAQKIADAPAPVTPKSLGFRAPSCTDCGLPIGRRAAGEEHKCLRCSAKEAA